jgi:DNA-binding transcriptional MerR regulator
LIKGELGFIINYMDVNKKAQKLNEDFTGGFGGPQVCQIIGITYRQLDYWDRTGLLKPSIKTASGHGSKRLYSYKDLLELKVIKRLLVADLSLPAIRVAVEFLKNKTSDEIASANLVLVGSKALLVQSGQELIDVLKGGQGVMNVLDLQNLTEELDADISHISKESEAIEGAIRIS